VIMACELYCCLLPQCEALRSCRSGFPIATPLSLRAWWVLSQIVQMCWVSARISWTRKTLDLSY